MTSKQPLIQAALHTRDYSVAAVRQNMSQEETIEAQDAINSAFMDFLDLIHAEITND